MVADQDLLEKYYYFLTEAFIIVWDRGDLVNHVRYERDKYNYHA